MSARFLHLSAIKTKVLEVSYKALAPVPSLTLLLAFSSPPLPQLASWRCLSDTGTLSPCYLVLCQVFHPACTPNNFQFLFKCHHLWHIPHHFYLILLASFHCTLQLLFFFIFIEHRLPSGIQGHFLVFLFFCIFFLPFHPLFFVTRLS